MLGIWLRHSSGVLAFATMMDFLSLCSSPVTPPLKKSRETSSEEESSPQKKKRRQECRLKKSLKSPRKRHLKKMRKPGSGFTLGGRQRDLNQKLKGWKMSEDFQVFGEQVGCRSCMERKKHMDKVAGPVKEKKHCLENGSLSGNNILNITLF